MEEKIFLRLKRIIGNSSKGLLRSWDSKSSEVMGYPRASPAKGDKGESRYSQMNTPKVKALELCQSKSEGSVARSTLAKGKSKTATDPKGKEIAPPLEAKKAKPRNVVSSKATHMPKLREGPSVNPATMLGLELSFWVAPRWPRRFCFRVVPLADKERAVVLGSSSLAIQNREAGDTVTLQQGFDFCKRQHHRHHPDLIIYLKGMGLDHDLLDEEDQKGEQGEVEKEK
ncbi:hypothetical protein Acr_16g0000350 [Actinidia rufa]|uniref:Uncharacterized protein n=1 Tax=Actinidia rufa TaxID=165716 RepID=A0A7J0FXI9_9ERIC|nr:hypothetical protein Acr_16g0000350 [Actinidia rufa]